MRRTGKIFSDYGLMPVLRRISHSDSAHSLDHDARESGEGEALTQLVADHTIHEHSSKLSPSRPGSFGRFGYLESSSLRIGPRSRGEQGIEPLRRRLQDSQFCRARTPDQDTSLGLGVGARSSPADVSQSERSARLPEAELRQEGMNLHRQCRGLQAVDRSPWR